MENYFVVCVQMKIFKHKKTIWYVCVPLAIDNLDHVY